MHQKFILVVIHIYLMIIIYEIKLDRNIYGTSNSYIRNLILNIIVYQIPFNNPVKLRYHMMILSKLKKHDNSYIYHHNYMRI